MVNRRTIRTGRGRDPTVERAEKNFGFERFGNVIIHARVEATFAVSLHGVGGHGNDGNVVTGLEFAFANQAGCVEAIHVGHLHIHQDCAIGGIAGFLKRLRARFHCVHGEACLLEKDDRQFLVDRIIFGKQDSLADFSFFFENVTRDDPDALFLFLVQDGYNGVEEHLLFNGFEQVTRDPQPFEAVGIATLAHRGEDDNLDFLQRGIAFDGAGGLLTIHERHLHIE